MLKTNAFYEAFKNAAILHIPHSSVKFPDLVGFNENLANEVNLLTDFATDKIFNVKDVTQIVAQISRLFCDVERFEDVDEPMLSVGRGFYYTHGYNGEPLRELNAEHKEMVYRDYYQIHHDWLNAAVSNKLDDYGVVYIIDCHSFNDAPVIPFVSSSESESPDICIGTDVFHTPQWLTDYTVKYFQNLGYSVNVDQPYAGTLISKDHYLKNKKVRGVMVEFNKRLYMDGLIVDNEKVQLLNQLMVN